MIKRILNRFAKSQAIGGPSYMRRWFLLVLGPLAEVYLHRFEGPDAGRWSHDHPWLLNVTIVLRGAYWEQKYVRGQKAGDRKLRRAGRVVVRFGSAEHRIEEIKSADACVTLFIGLGRWREWGFWSPEGEFVDHHTYKRAK